MSGSGLNQEFVCYLDDGRQLKAQVDMRDSTAWERTFKRGWFESDRPSLGMMVWRCWHALQRQGEFSGGYPEFEKSLVDLDAITAEGDAASDPTQSGPGVEP